MSLLNKFVLIETISIVVSCYQLVYLGLNFCFAIVQEYIINYAVQTT